MKYKLLQNTTGFKAGTIKSLTEWLDNFFDIADINKENLFKPVDTIEVEIPEGCKVKYTHQVTNGESTWIQLDLEKEVKLPKSWEELSCSTEPFEMNYGGELQLLRKLLILRDVYRQGWKPNWEGSVKNYTIYLSRSEWFCGLHDNLAELFSFQSEEIRDEFYNNFKEDLEKIKILFQ